MQGRGNSSVTWRRKNQHFPRKVTEGTEHMTYFPDLSTYLVQHLKLDHQLHAGQRPHPHASILATGGTVRFTGAEDHLVYLWDPQTVEGMPIWAFPTQISRPGSPHRNNCLLPKST